jgi:hypothetical protein
MFGNLRRAALVLGQVFTISSTFALLGCTETLDSSDGLDDSEAAVETTNGLSSINGLGMHNGLGMQNGLALQNGLGMQNGLALQNGLMTTSAGRTTMEYVVRCALPAGRSVTAKDQNGVNYSFQGQLGFAPQWETGACDVVCQEYLSACLMAHVNTSGTHVPLFVVSEAKGIGWDLSADYPNQEGSFFGNLFVLGAHGVDATSVAAFYCKPDQRPLQEPLHRRPLRHQRQRLLQRRLHPRQRRLRR